jgi:hypothetical protein
MNISTIILFVFITSSLFAQKTKVEESVVKIAGGNNNALTVLISEANQKSVTNEWISYMKNNKAKVKGKKEIFADDAILPLLSPNSVDVYAIITQSKNDVKLIVAFDLGGAFLSSKAHPFQYEAAEKMIYDFSVNISKQNVQSSMATEKKNMSTLEKRKSKLAKSNSSMQKSNQKMNQQIESNEKSINSNQKEIENIDKELKDIKGRMENLEKKFKAID